jgi:transcriptional regulator with XRE-family HTH domain
MPRLKNPRKPNPVDAVVGGNLRLWRVAKGLSQSQFANRLGVTFQQVQKYEVGANRVPTGRLVKAAAILGVPIAALFDGTADPSESVSGLISNARSFRLAQGFAAIRNNKFRESLVALVESLASLAQKPKRRRR